MNKKEPEFTVTDRRKFTVEGSLRDDATVEENVAPPAQPEAAAPAEAAKPAPVEQAPAPAPEQPAGPSREQREKGHGEYKKSTANLEAELREQYGPQVAQEFEVTFERVLEPFYVTALMQLGMMGQEGPERRVDIIGARQTIDTLSLLHEKTKASLTAQEENLIQTMLYQLRMAYVEVTNALSRAAQTGAPGPAKK